MKKILALFLAVFMMMSVCAFAEDDTEICVTGTGSSVVAADTVTISLGVNVRGVDAIDAQTGVNAAIANICKTLTENGVDPAMINTDYINLYPEMDYSSSISTVVGYNASCTLSVRVNDIEAAGNYIDMALEAGANNLNGVMFSASEYSEAETEAMNMAVADARIKAEVLAAASGLKITGIESINMGSNAGIPDSYSNNYKAEAADTAGTELRSAGLTVTREVTIVFKAEQK